MSKQDIKLVTGDDWIGIYIDGILVAENHSYDADDLLTILDIDHTCVSAEEQISEIGRCPAFYEDVDTDESRNKLRQQIKDQALSKLSPEEREALGL